MDDLILIIFACLVGLAFINFSLITIVCSALEGTKTAKAIDEKIANLIGGKR